MPAIISDFLKLFLDSRVSLASKFLFIALVGVYLVLPIDLIPDFLLPLGVVDDGGLILAAVVAFTRHARNQVEDNIVVAPPGSDDIVVSPSHQSGASEVKSAVVPAAATNYNPPTQYIHHQSRSSRPNYGCLTLFALLILSPCIGLALILLSGNMAISGILSPIINRFNLPASANIVSSQTLALSLQGLGQLITVSSEVAKTDIRVSIHEGALNMGYYSANHVAFGSIKAGIDITDFDRDDVIYDLQNNSYTLRFPPPIITDCNIEHIDQYDYSLTLLPADWDTVRQLAEYEAIERFRQDVLEGGILDEARTEASLRLGTFVSELTGSAVRIEFAEAEAEAEAGDTCQPDFPAGWKKDEEGAWVRTG